MANENKFYTFLNVTDGPDGVKNCTTIVTLTRPELRTLQADKKVLTCSAAISNREKTLSSIFGQEISASSDGTVWVDVQFWNSLADRFQKFLGERDKVRLVLCGRLSLRKWKDDDGNDHHKVQISVNDWAVYPTASSEKKEEAKEEILY